MKYAKKKDKAIQAWELGAATQMEKNMVSQGKIKLLPDGKYELFSEECLDGKGEIAQAGDYFKVSAKGFPYPNSREFFLANHVHIKDEWYTQISKPLQIWDRKDEISEEIRFLLDHGKLIIHPETPDQYFSANLWGTEEKAAEDTVIVFYSVDRNPDGTIDNISFNFVSREAFDQTYDIISI